MVTVEVDPVRVESRLAAGEIGWSVRTTTGQHGTVGTTAGGQARAVRAARDGGMDHSRDRRRARHARGRTAGPLRGEAGSGSRR
jgi:hypothetical protein